MNVTAAASGFIDGKVSVCRLLKRAQGMRHSGRELDLRTIHFVARMNGNLPKEFYGRHDNQI